MSVTEPSLPAPAGQLPARRPQVARQLDLVLDESGPAGEVRRLIADLDRISAELAEVLGAGDAPALRAGD
jgi:hypothetical protein